MKTQLFSLLLGVGLLCSAISFAQDSPTIITVYEDDFESSIASGWDINARSHTLTQADGILTIAVDKPSDAEKWDGLTMGFGTNTLLDLTENGWFTVDLKADANCTVDISVYDSAAVYNPGNNNLELTAGADWVTMEFNYIGDNLIKYKWDGSILDTVDASIIQNLLMTFNGGSAWTGNVYMDNLSIGIGSPPDTAEVTFIVDDSQSQSAAGFAIKGSWDTESGRYDAAWSDGNEHSDFYDDGTHGDLTADDHIWTVTLRLIPDGGENTWEWGVNDTDGNWIDGNFQFTVADASDQSLDPFVIVGIDDVQVDAIYNVYPNPTSSEINIGNAIKVTKVTLINTKGQLVIDYNNIQSETIKISLESLNPGLYILRMTEGNGNFADRKILVH